MFGFSTIEKDNLCIQHKKELINLVKGDILHLHILLYYALVEYYINKHPLGINNIGSI